MKIKTVSLALFVSLLLSGCASNSYTDAPPTLGLLYSKYAYIGYEGELKPIKEVGIVTTDGIIKVLSINNTPISSFKSFITSGFYSGGRYQLHLLPGTYELGLAFHFDKGTGYRAWSTSEIKKPITIVEGQVLHLSWIDDGNKWSVQESDGSKAITTIHNDFIELAQSK